MIELRGVTKVYPTHRGPNVVLRNITATIPALTNYGILGHNGSGKSTLLRLLSGVEFPDTGEVIRRARISWPIGFSGGFNGSLTGVENCRFVARVFGVDVDDVTAFALDFSELGPYFEMPVRTYSSGMKARLAFALSMAIEFDCYLVDEVTAVGDKRFQQKCRAAFLERKNRSSVIIVSHSMGTIRSYCQQCAVLHHGTLVHFDSVRDAASFYDQNCDEYGRHSNQFRIATR
jgi:capsular polysaccharide transport system ATP-binding protein